MSSDELNGTYKLQVKIPFVEDESGYCRGDGYWNTVERSSSLEYVQSQRAIMEGFWKHVRIIQTERVVVKERVIE